SGANEGRLHALYHRVALQLRADCLAHGRPAAVATHHIGATYGLGLASVYVAYGRRDAEIVLLKFFKLGAVDNGYAGLLLGMLEEYWFQVNLVDSMRRFGGRPVGVRTAEVGIAVASARDMDARQFVPGGRRAVGNAVLVVFREPVGTHGRSDTQPAKNLH